MKKTFTLVALTVILTSCGGLLPYGPVYADVTIPNESTGTAGNRTGQSESVTWFGIVSLGDSSLKKAKASAGISKVSTQDSHIKNILSIYTKTTTIVTGS